MQLCFGGDHEDLRDGIPIGKKWWALPQSRGGRTLSVGSVRDLPTQTNVEINKGSDAELWIGNTDNLAYPVDAGNFPSLCIFSNSLFSVLCA